MSLHKIDLNLLVVFQAIYKEGHLTRAGFRLGRTPSAISHALNRLRSLWDDPLFLRQGTQMIPTQKAESMASDIFDALDLMERAFQNKHIFDPSVSSRTYTLGIMDYCAFVVLPRLISFTSLQAPNLNLQIKHIPYEERPAAMENGTVDMIIGIEQHYGANVYQQHLFSDQTVCICRQGHPRISQTLTFEQYIAEKFIDLYWPLFDVDSIDEHIQHKGFQRNIALLLEHEFIIPDIICCTDYLANLYRRQVNIFQKHLPITIFPLPFSIPEDNYYQFWHARIHDDPGLLWLRRQIKIICSQLDNQNAS